jgi:hypothetical protein
VTVEGQSAEERAGGVGELREGDDARPRMRVAHGAKPGDAGRVGRRRGLEQGRRSANGRGVGGDVCGERVAVRG